jgi:hypothetical protein
MDECMRWDVRWKPTILVLGSGLLLLALHRLELLVIVLPVSVAASYLSGKRKIRAGKL